MSISAQIGLDATLARLQNIDIVIRAGEGGTFQRGFGSQGGTRLFQGQRRTFETPATDNTLFLGNDENNSVKGRRGDDILLGNAGDDQILSASGDDVVFGGDGLDFIVGGEGQDTLFGGAAADQLFGEQGDDFLAGGLDKDSLDGGVGNDRLVGGDGVDTLTGGEGRDQFMYEGNVFANGPLAPAGATGINIVNQPDVVADYTIGEDQFAFSGQDLGLQNLTFQKGQAAQIATDGNLVVLTDPFPAAGAAARAIANNNNITADEGVFAYFNSTLGLTRLVYSKDLSDGGDISVLANLNNQRGEVGLANTANFTAADFTLV